MKFPGAHSHWRYNTVSAPFLLLYALWPLPLYAYSWPVTAGAQLHSGERNAPVFVPAFNRLWREVGYQLCALLVFISVSGPWWWRSDVKMVTVLWRLSWLGRGVMNGDHAGGLELWKVETKFVLHPGKSGCSQAVASDVVGVDGRKLWNARLWCRFRSRWTTAESRELESPFTLEHILQMDCSTFKNKIQLNFIIYIYSILVPGWFIESKISNFAVNAPNTFFSKLLVSKE